MRWLVGLSLVAASACGPKEPPQSPPQPVANDAPMPHPRRLHGVLPLFRERLPPPAIDLGAYVPDFHDELRWPLSGMSHPALEPRFDIAQQLAEPGVDWQELCARGVQNRVSSTQKELLEYLHGWCDAQNSNVDGACKHLLPLLGSTTRGLTVAVRTDLANILAAGDADKAEHWLTKHNIRDIDTLDLLAANYAEQGLLDDAATINRRIIDSDDFATEATKCRRLVRQLATNHDSGETVAYLQLEQLAKKPKVPDPLCVRLFHKAECRRNPATDRANYFSDENIDRRGLYVLKAYGQWPTGSGNWIDWWPIAVVARKAAGLAGANELAVAALEAGFSAQRGCPIGSKKNVRDMLRALRLDAEEPLYEARLKALAAACDFDWDNLPYTDVTVGAPASATPASTTTAP